MRVCGLLHQFWPPTVNRVDFCGATVHSKLFLLAIFEGKSRAPAIIAAWSVVDRWNYIINGVVTAQIGIRATGCRLSLPELSCERRIRRPAVGHLQTVGNLRSPGSCTDNTPGLHLRNPALWRPRLQALRWLGFTKSFATPYARRRAGAKRFRLSKA
jgi:hypothetical protein